MEISINSPVTNIVPVVPGEKSRNERNCVVTQLCISTNKAFYLRILVITLESSDLGVTCRPGETAASGRVVDEDMCDLKQTND